MGPANRFRKRHLTTALDDTEGCPGVVEARCLAGPPATFAAYLPPAREAARLAATVRALSFKRYPSCPLR